MVNILICIKDLKLINKILDTNNNIKASGIVTDIDEIIEGVNDKNNRIILIDFKLMKDDMNLFKRINRKSILKNNIIIIDCDNEISENLTFNKDIIIVNDINGLKKNISELVDKIDREDTRNAIYRHLEYLGYNTRHIGTKYICDMITYIYYNNKYFVDNLNQEVYPEVSKLYNKKIETVKNSTIYATDYMSYSCTKEKIEDYFGYDDCVKPTTKRVIFSILGKIKY